MAVSSPRGGPAAGAGRPGGGPCSALLRGLTGVVVACGGLGGRELQSDRAWAGFALVVGAFRGGCGQRESAGVLQSRVRSSAVNEASPRRPAVRLLPLPSPCQAEGRLCFQTLPCNPRSLNRAKRLRTLHREVNLLERFLYFFFFPF